MAALTRRLQHLSRLLAYTLRHETDSASTKLEDGVLWHSVETLLEKPSFSRFARFDIEHVIQNSVKDGVQRYESRTLDGLQYVRAISKRSRTCDSQQHGNKRSQKEQPASPTISVCICDALTGDNVFEHVLFDRTSHLLDLRDTVAEAKQCRPHLVQLLDQDKPIEIWKWRKSGWCSRFGDVSLEKTNVGAGRDEVSLQVVMKEDPLVMLLQASYQWLSQRATAPSIKEFEAFFGGAWENHGGTAVVPVEDVGDEEKKECLDCINGLIEDLSSALDAGDTKDWNNTTVDMFLEAADACCANKWEGLARESNMLWWNITSFFEAGKFYE
eukprot:TRINITY_DN75484_c0_g1_i1.p1 TRINITY_DN75484_c0_g1~~TRINITY_DN75484_c0_g1_i1.p1  ORF type:complete len:347 (-),score=44.05 TRINITY_DN75484_c0_g1_i1:193-1176(-)